MTAQSTLRFAQFNLSLAGRKVGDIKSQMLASTPSRQIKNLAATLQRVRPDVVVLCEFDHPGNGGDDGALAAFCERHLAEPQHGETPIDYPYRYLPATNTGLTLTVPVSEQQHVTDAQQCHGFGHYHGQFGFVIISRYPIEDAAIRTWQHFAWHQLPHHQIPASYYTEQAQKALRLASKNLVSVPIDIGDDRIQVVACHPTPPVFDGPEKRNWCRNSDEIHQLIGLLDNADWLVDDKGAGGGLTPEAPFVVIGDLNADPSYGDGDKQAIGALLNHHRVHPEVATGTQVPKSEAALSHAFRFIDGKGRPIATHNGGLRLDYVLPSRELAVRSSGVFWPAPDDADYPLICDKNGQEHARAHSDHRLAWVDVQLT
ncbi:endonuclease/exonuclease/phosphatase family protein [Salinivibrio socompensis]|uniref:endonuclease/exonuclease/phosphatase family protein n=1 Tax=Salinivibrio socompensis TaxID=1510206 RepID=UPI0004BCCE68|nr:endonuclease/exonuclease/phosphatase family protein [Salinivibrio socompensis]